MLSYEEFGCLNLTNETIASRETKPYSIVLACDCHVGVLSRVLDVYRFFRRPPRIFLARKRRGVRVWESQIPKDPGVAVQTEFIPIPIMMSENLNLGRAVPPFLGYLYYSLVLYLKLVRSRAGINLVHSHCIFPQGLFGLLLARLLHVPLIVTANGLDVNSFMKKSAMLRFACLFVLKRSYTTIAVSNPILMSLRRHGISNSVYLPNSIDVSSVLPVVKTTKKDSIIYVGTLTENKRPLVLVRAFDIVVRKVPTARLVICGDGPLMPLLRKEITSKGLEDKVELLSFVNRETLNNCRSHAEIFVHPSASEGLSRALLEAMAAGQVVVASRNESQEAILSDGDNSLLFEVDNSEELSSKILLAISDGNLRKRISESAKRLCETRFSNAVVASRLEDVYLRAMQSPAAK